MHKPVKVNTLDRSLLAEHAKAISLWVDERCCCGNCLLLLDDQLQNMQTVLNRYLFKTKHQQ